MKLLVAALLAVGTARLMAEPPTCETKMVDGHEFRLCHRSDQNCGALASEQVAHPSPSWNGCRDAFFILSWLNFNGLVSYNTHISLVSSFIDSEEFDIEVRIPLRDGRSKTVRTTVQIIIEKDIPMAVYEFWSLDPPEGIPVVKAIEKGGAKEGLHLYQ